MKRLILLSGIVFFFITSGCNGGAEDKPKPPASAVQPSAQSSPAVSLAPESVATPKPVPREKKFQPLVIYTNKGSHENHFVPSGFMPDGKCLTLDDMFQEKCFAGKTCMKIVYDTACSKQGQKWAGVYWLNPANNWGNRKGGFNLTGAEKLTFWARGEKGGERIEEFKIGGITGDYPDTDTAVIGPVILTPEWRQYSIDLRGKDLSYISGGFSWATNVDVNPSTCTFYLDNIQYE